MIMNNTFRKALEAGKSTIGTHFLFSDPDVAELIGDTGLFDYAEYSAEYSARRIFRTNIPQEYSPRRMFRGNSPREEDSMGGIFREKKFHGENIQLHY